MPHFPQQWNGTDLGRAIMLQRQVPTEFDSQLQTSLTSLPTFQTMLVPLQVRQHKQSGSFGSNSNLSSGDNYPIVWEGSTRITLSREFSLPTWGSKCSAVSPYQLHLTSRTQVPIHKEHPIFLLQLWEHWSAHLKFVPKIQCPIKQGFQSRVVSKQPPIGRCILIYIFKLNFLYYADYTIILRQLQKLDSCYL